MLKPSRPEQLSGKWGFKNYTKHTQWGYIFILKVIVVQRILFVCCQNEKDFYAVQKLTLFLLGGGQLWTYKMPFFAEK